LFQSAGTAKQASSEMSESDTSGSEMSESDMAVYVYGVIETIIKVKLALSLTYIVCSY
jgi:hypothetical protein